MKSFTEKQKQNTEIGWVEKFQNIFTLSWNYERGKA